MKPKAGFLALALAFSLAGCVLGGKPKPPATPAAPSPSASTAAPAPPPAPLSIPQTQVQLPAPQPLDPEALATVPPPEQPAEPPTAPRPMRGRTNVAPAQPKPESPPQAQPPQPAPPVAQPVEPERPPVQAIIPADEQKKLQESAQAQRREVKQLLASVPAPRTSRQRDIRKRVESFLNQSDQAELKGDMLQANAFAERALALARELQSGR